MRPKAKPIRNAGNRPLLLPVVDCVQVAVAGSSSSPTETGGNTREAMGDDVQGAVASSNSPPADTGRNISESVGDEVQGAVATSDSPPAETGRNISESVGDDVQGAVAGSNSPPDETKRSLDDDEEDDGATAVSDGKTVIRRKVSDDAAAVSAKVIDSKPMSCPYCGKRYARKGYFYSHLLSHTNGGYLCLDCDRRFFYSDELERHLELHRKPRPHVCPLCEQRFSRKQELKIHHIRRHTNSRPFVCAKCGREFSRPEDLKAHEKRHAAREQELRAAQSSTTDRQEFCVVSHSPLVVTRPPFYESCLLSAAVA